MELTDVTVREAAQMPGRSYSVDQRVQAAEAIDSLGVTRIQPGFPAAGDREQAVVRELTETVDADVVAISRAVSADVEAALNADAECIEVFVPVSEHHLNHDLKKSFESVLAMIDDAIKTGEAQGAAVQLMILDGFRTSAERLNTVFERYDHLPMIGLADTVGCRSPKTVDETLSSLSEQFDLGKVSVHFHNDLGVGTANVMRAYESGVKNADVSIGALGERVGNPSLEEVIALSTLEYGDPFGTDNKSLIPVAEEVMDILGETIDDRRPIIGSAATTHEAGIHTTAMLDEPSLFEPFDPARFGGERTLVFGEGTGRSGGAKLLRAADVEPTDDTIRRYLDALATEGPMDEHAALRLAKQIENSK